MATTWLVQHRRHPRQRVCLPQGVETMFVMLPRLVGTAAVHCGRVRKRHWFPHVWFCQRRDARRRGGPVHDGAHCQKVDRARGNIGGRFPQYVSAVEANTHSTYENRKATFNGTAIGYRRRTFSYFLECSGSIPSVPRQGMMFSDALPSSTEQRRCVRDHPHAQRCHV